ncbi:hypothetical protein D3C87_347590 [compost metagenome]
MDLNQIKMAAKKILDPDLSKAVGLAVYLIGEREFSLKSAVKSASKHYAVKAHIEREIRDLFPTNYFTDRSKQHFINSLPAVDKGALVGKAIMKGQLQRQQTRHMAEIKLCA